MKTNNIYSVFSVDNRIMPIKFIRSSYSRDIAETIMTHCAEADKGLVNYVLVDIDHRIITVAFNKETQAVYGITSSFDDETLQ